jgi:GrpB-like predicted nucleotidyltransferase (UPF0157 family)
MIRKVEVVPHDRHWQSLFKAESQQLSIAFGANAIAIHHIGSTAISTIYAKPIIDILIEVKQIDRVDNRNAQIQALGYISIGKFGITTNLRTLHRQAFIPNRSANY